MRSNADNEFVETIWQDTTFEGVDHNMEQDYARAEVEEDTDLTADEIGDRYSKRFLDALKAADEPLLFGSEKHTQLSAVARLMHLKSEYNISEKCVNRFLHLIDEMLPAAHNLPASNYQTKRLMRDLGLPVEKG